MLRRVIQKALKALPKPPYADASYWDKVYSETFQSQGAIEWGVPPALLFNYQWISENGEHVNQNKMLKYGCHHKTHRMVIRIYHD